MTRRIVYITTTAAPLFVDETPHVYTTALCNDGTVWQHIEGEPAWTRLPPIALTTDVEDDDPFPDNDFDFADFDDYQAVTL